MLESERQILAGKKEGDYLSVGISEGGVHYNMGRVYWRERVNALNMKLPDLYLAPEDIYDEELLNKLERYNVTAFYILAPIEEYGFLSRFPAIRELNIGFGENLKNLDFLKSLKECSMFFLADAKLENIDIIVEKNISEPKFFSRLRNVILYNCEIENLSAFEREGYDFGEFTVWSSKNDESRWEVVKADKRRYYELRPLDEPKNP